ncbi:hypothetical protein PGB28_14200 [Primorskyibacter aestuariivivens]|uniref:hypothetical protein n=1 Tax=Primorskyibacter aestuariivivens TaxID=1888912 RepID=UPI0023016C10|nr:hypothetical protein [Primorskyibacter aestuariivivens]MDA7429618.1 hypothetical protein [Primorskyibacter aestuariivivens]
MSHRPRLFIDVQHGLCNRLRAMASGASIAQATGRELVVIWRPDHHCNARIGDLLDYDGPVIEDDVADLCRRFSSRVYNYMEIEEGAVYEEPVQAEAFPDGDIYVRSAYTLVSSHRDEAREDSFLRALRPAAPVRELLDQVPHPNPVAAHIRMATGPRFDHLSYEAPENWPAERHAEMLHWRERSQPEAFERRLDQLIEEGKADRVFLAADLAATYERFGARYGNRLVHLPRQLYDRSARQLQYALADLLLLIAADRLLASTWSSFSDMAQRLARPGRSFEQSGQDF